MSEDNAIKIAVSLDQERPFVDRARRLQITIPVSIQSLHQEPATILRTVTRNVSLGGLCFLLAADYTEMEFNINEEVRIFITDDKHGKFCEVSGKIRHISEQPDREKMVGVELAEAVFDWLLSCEQ